MERHKTGFLIVLNLTTETEMPSQGRTAWPGQRRASFSRAAARLWARDEQER